MHAARHSTTHSNPACAAAPRAASFAADGPSTPPPASKATRRVQLASDQQLAEHSGPEARLGMMEMGVQASPTQSATNGGDAPPMNVSLDDDETHTAIEEARRRCSPFGWRLRQEVT